MHLIGRYLSAGILFSSLLTAVHAENQGTSAHEQATGESDALSLLNLDLPGMEEVKAAASRHDMDAVKQAYLEFRQKKSGTKIWKDIATPPADTGATDQTAEEICRHYIRHKYTVEPRSADMGQDFNWHYCPIPMNSPAYTDEWTRCAVSRTHFWETLTDAYTKTGNPKYAREWVSQLLDFARKNPVDFSLAKADPKTGMVNLWYPLDIAIRVQYSWLTSYYRCVNSGAMTPEANWTFLRLMNDHIAVLRKGLKKTKDGNQKAVVCSAFFSVGTLFPEFKEAAEWRKMALDELLAQANDVVPPDGFEAELTPNYHFVTLNGFITPVELAQRNQIAVPQELKAKMLLMYRAAVMVMDQDGKIPPVNDSVIVDAVDRARQGLKLLGNDPLLAWAASGGKEGQQPPESLVLPYAGFYVMRSGWKRDDTYLFFRAGPAGIGHQHEDMLQIVLRAGGQTLLFDPGTYTYDHSDWRRYILNTPSHNTVIVDGKWQHRGANKPPVTQPVQNPWVISPAFDYVSATYDQGYQTNVYNKKWQGSPETWVGDKDRSVSHTRHILFLKPRYVLVLDYLNGTGEHTFDAHFHIDAPAASQNPITQSITSQSPAGVQLSLYPLDRRDLQTDIVIGQNEPLLGWYPGTNDNEHRPIPTVRFRKKQAAPAIIATLLIPHTGATPPVTAQSLRVSDDLWAQQITTSSETMTIAITRDQQAKIFSFTDAASGLVQAQAEGLVIRKAQDSTVTSTGMWGARSFSSDKLGLSSAQPFTLLAVQRADGLYVMNTGSADATIQLTRPWQQEMTLAPGRWQIVTPTGVHEAASEPELFGTISDTLRH